MSDITIERKGGYWEANDGAWSLDGMEWMAPNGHRVDGGGVEQLYRTALREHLDTTAEPQRAKVGDWVKSIHYPERDAFKVEVSTEYTVANNRFGIKHGDYTIVPDHTPEREVFTGPPDKWGKGRFKQVDGPWAVFVDGTGEWAAIADDGFVLGSRLRKGFSFGKGFHRISDNPADGVKREGGEG